MQRQPGAVEAPVEPLDHAGGRLALVALADHAARTARPRPAPRSGGRRGASRTLPRRARRPAAAVTGVASPPSTSITYSCRSPSRSDRKASDAAVGREPRRAVLAGAGGQLPRPAAAVRHQPDRAAVGVAGRRAPRVGDQVPVRGERHLAERDLPAQVGRYHAMTSTCGVPPCSSSRASTFCSESIETSSWSSVGTPRGQALQPQPGREGGADERVLPVPAGESDHLVRDAGDREEKGDAREHEEVPVVGLADDDVDEDRHEHHPEQERGAAADVDARVLRHRVGRQLVAGLERVDGHVLGGVVLEHALQVGDQRQERQVADQDADADQALDQREHRRRPGRTGW